MFLDIVLDGFAALAIVVTLWSLAVAFNPRTNNTMRKHAMGVFHIACKTAIVSMFVALIRFSTSGIFIG